MSKPIKPVVPDDLATQAIEIVWAYQDGYRCGQHDDPKLGDDSPLDQDQTYAQEECPTHYDDRGKPTNQQLQYLVCRAFIRGYREARK